MLVSYAASFIIRQCMQGLSDLQVLRRHILLLLPSLQSNLLYPTDPLFSFLPLILLFRPGLPALHSRQLVLLGRADLVLRQRVDNILVFDLFGGDSKEHLHDILKTVGLLVEIARHYLPLTVHVLFGCQVVNDQVAVE